MTGDGYSESNCLAEQEKSSARAERFPMNDENLVDGARSAIGLERALRLERERISLDALERAIEIRDNFLSPDEQNCASGPAGTRR